MKNLKRQNAITLIALVITIIVLLILAGITIGALTGEDGILKNTELAAIETRGASVQEARDIWFAEIYLAEITGGTAKSMDEILQDLLDQGMLTQEEVDIIKAEDNVNREITIGSKTISFSTNYMPEEANIPIPEGFVASKVQGEDTIEDGLVIYEGEEDVTEENHEEALTTRNQYIWIPVADINSMSMCKSNSEGSVCNLELQTDGTLQCTIHADTATEIVGRLYTNITESETIEQNASGEEVTIYSRIINFEQTNQIYDANDGYREPAVVTKNSSGDTAYDADETNNYHEYGTASAFLEVLEEEYIKMATSVAKNGGFYVSRYEMGASGASKKDQAVINASSSSANMWYGLYKIAKNANTTLNSHMIWRKSV